MEGQEVIVCDLGTGYMKVGYSGDNFPRRTFPSIIGRPMLRSEQIIEDVVLKPVMIGDEVSKYRSILELSHPTQEGIVKNWDDMTLLLDYTFKNIGVEDTRGRTVMMTEAVRNPQSNRQKMLQTLFEKFQFGRVQVAVQALMSLFAQGRDTAILVDSGDGVTHCIPVYKNYIMSHNIQRLNVAGRHITKQLTELMHAQGYAFNSTADFETIRQFKEKYCFVSGNIKVDKKLALETTHHIVKHRMPDGSLVSLGRQRFMAPEILFEPFLIGNESLGIGQMVFKCINDSDMSTRRQFYKSILISGGTTMLPGFPTRLRNEVEAYYRQRVLKNSSVKGVQITVLDPPTRRYNVFIGAAFMARLSAPTDEGWITKAEYDEHGKNVLSKVAPNVH